MDVLNLTTLEHFTDGSAVESARAGSRSHFLQKSGDCIVILSSGEESYIKEILRSLYSESLRIRKNQTRIQKSDYASGARNM